MTDAQERTGPRRWIAFAAIMGPYVFYAFCWNTENFLRPFLAEDLGLSRAQVSSFYSIQALGSLLGAVIVAQLADRHGRRLIYVLTSVGFGVAAVGALLVTGYLSALLQRFVMGFLLGGVYGCAVSLYVGLFSAALRGLLAGIVQLVYNGGDALLAWSGGHAVALGWRHVMVIGGVGAILTGAAAYALIPEDDTTRAGKIVHGAGNAPGLLADLFQNGRWKLTLRLAALCGLNFLAIVSFNSWLTSYLKEIRGLSPQSVGHMLALMHLGSMAGAILWGLAADRLGRRFNALGFLAAGLLIGVYFQIHSAGAVLAAAGFAYGFCFVASGIWGPYFTELYPERLRATAASIFNWGRAMSLLGALASGAIAQRYGLTAAMSLGSGLFIGAALLWRSLPETLPAK